MTNYQSEGFTYPDDFLHIIHNGLSSSVQKKRIIIIGAGMAGLTAGSLLKAAGHEVTILEAGSRLGGRVYTVRSPFSNGNYLDVGAMRIPTNHKLVYAYIDKFGLETAPFQNTRTNDLMLINGKSVYSKDYEKNPAILDFPVDPEEQGKTAKDLFLSAVRPFLDLYNSSSDAEKERLRDQFSDLSMGEYLRNNPYGPSLSLNAVRKIKVVLGIEGFPEFAFLNILTDITFPIFQGDTKFREIKGGNDRLPWAFYPYLSSSIHFCERAVAINHYKDGVQVVSKNEKNGGFSTWCGDYVLTTIPFTTFQWIDVHPYDTICIKKWTAIHEIINVPAVKIGIEFSCKFWEQYPVGNIITDYPSRFIYQPSHDSGKPGPGILLASYTWGQNALLFNSLSKKRAVEEVLSDLARVYGRVVYDTYMTSIVYNWSRNPYSAGCFTLFTPGQSRDLEDIIPLPEGRIHFAGEHTSSYHGWIEGAIESGIRGAAEIHNR
ncbi:NAD(P)-binding protein [Halobacillus halophilus]|uniref:flavin monoamine oxidase family protein n=1 Tax=Halobacillus halophilus TaxID=1570 RepID=UPI00136D3030|nr:flavin monoamine oxidase family protein [Halobacillus halophilus]MYL31552.1 NAD(P)-binding protein [Halobacillus halophilus]